MKKIINVIIVIALIVSVGFNIFLIIEKNKVTDQISNQEEQITSLNSEIEKVKSDSDSKDNAIEELNNQIVDKDEEIKGIQESLVSLKTEKEQLKKEIADKSITVVEQGNSQTSGAPGGNANVGTENGTTSDIEKFCAEFGAEYIGSGGSVGNIGNGGYGITFD